MTRRTSAAQLELDLTPPAPASGTRAATAEGPYRFVWCRPGGDVIVDVPRRDQGGWTGEPRCVPQSEEARDRAVMLHAAKVAAETPGGARGSKTETGRVEHPKVDAAAVRALLTTGARDHNEVAAAMGIGVEAAKGILTHLRNVGHAHEEARRERKRTGKGGSRTIGVWGLTAKGRLKAMRDAKGGKRSTWNDGYRKAE